MAQFAHSRLFTSSRSSHRLSQLSVVAVSTAASSRRSRRAALRCHASIVSTSSLPDEFRDGYKLQFVVFSRLAPEKTTSSLKEHLGEHEAWLKSLGDRLQFYGPFLNAEASYYGSEMYAVLADSAAEARQLVEQDPVHKKGIRKFELMSWVQKLDTEAADYSD